MVVDIKSLYILYMKIKCILNLLTCLVTSSNIPRNFYFFYIYSNRLILLFIHLFIVISLQNFSYININIQLGPKFITKILWLLNDFCLILIKTKTNKMTINEWELHQHLLLLRMFFTRNLFIWSDSIFRILIKLTKKNYSQFHFIFSIQ
jgi:hypothetical protein